MELRGLYRLEQVQNYLHLGMVLVLTLLDFTFTSENINEFSVTVETIYKMFLSETMII